MAEKKDDTKKVEFAEVAERAVDPKAGPGADSARNFDPEDLLPYLLYKKKQPTP